MLFDTEAGNIIVRVGNQYRSLWQIGHQNTLGIGFRPKLLLDQASRFRVTRQREIKSFRCSRTGIVIRCGAYPAKADHRHIILTAMPQLHRQCVYIITNKVTACQLQTACRQRIDQMWQMLIFSLAAKLLITDDDGGEC